MAFNEFLRANSYSAGYLDQLTRGSDRYPWNAQADPICNHWLFCSLAFNCLGMRLETTKMLRKPTLMCRCIRSVQAIEV